MPDNRSSKGEGEGAGSRLGYGVIVVLLALYVGVVFAALEVIAWKELLHWIGEVLLLAGILLAAQGISNVRREWTGRPGLWGAMGQAAQGIRGRAAGFLWVRWNRALREWPRVAARFRLRLRKTRVHGGDAAIIGEGNITISGSAIGGQGSVAGALSIKERLERIERRMAEAEGRLDAFAQWRLDEIRERKAETEEERAERAAEDARLRTRMADLAGGGLRLQAWGVACLLAGTVLTALW